MTKPIPDRSVKRYIVSVEFATRRATLECGHVRQLPPGHSIIDRLPCPDCEAVAAPGDLQEFVGGPA